MLWQTDSTCHQRAMSLLDFSCVGAPKFEAALGRSRSRYSVNFLRSCNLAQPRSSFGNVNQSFRAFSVLPSWLDALLDARIAFAHTPELDALVGEELACFRSWGAHLTDWPLPCAGIAASQLLFFPHAGTRFFPSCTCRPHSVGTAAKQIV